MKVRTLSPFPFVILLAELSTERALEDPIHTTTNYTSTANIVVNVSIPASLVTEGRGISINILPKSNRRVEVHTERISERSDNESDHGLPFTVDVSRLNINEAPRTPARRNNTVVFDTSSSARQSPAAHTTYTPATAPGTPASGIRSSRWDDAVSVSDEEDEELVPIYPSPSGQREVAHHDQGDGRRYYVVTKGKKIGIFYTTW